LTDRAFLQDSHRARPVGLSFSVVGEADWPLLAQVYADSRAEELAPVAWPQAQKSAFLTQQFEAQRLHYATHYSGADLSVVRLHGQPIGRVYVYRSASELRLMDIALLTAFRGRGLGSAMLTELLDEADGAGQVVSLHVEHQNPVRRMYDRLGFEWVEERGAYVFLRRPVHSRIS
jgi:ribosomal protein S18 acetylase RimI-like enzyme